MRSPEQPAPGARTIAPLVDLRRVAIALAAYCTFFTLYAPQAVMPMLAREFARSAADTSLIMTASTLSVAPRLDAGNRAARAFPPAGGRQ